MGSLKNNERYWIHHAVDIRYTSEVLLSGFLEDTGVRNIRREESSVSYDPPYTSIPRCIGIDCV